MGYDLNSVKDMRSDSVPENVLTPEGTWRAKLDKFTFPEDGNDSKWQVHRFTFTEPAPGADVHEGQLKKFGNANSIEISFFIDWEPDGLPEDASAEEKLSTRGNVFSLQAMNQLLWAANNVEKSEESLGVLAEKGCGSILEFSVTHNKDKNGVERERFSGFKFVS